MLYWQRLLIVVYGTDSGEKREGLKADADMAQAQAHGRVTEPWKYGNTFLLLNPL